jgi:uncharacterized protein
MWDTFRRQLVNDGSVSFRVRARPNADRTEVAEILSDGSLKISLAAVAEEGRANAELVRYLADVFGVEKARVAIRSGTASRLKVVTVRR